MRECDFPALYRSANRLSLESQTQFFRALKLHLVLLVMAAILSVVNIHHWSVAAVQLLTLLGALACSIYLFSMRPDRCWHAARAVSESIKTITWRYVCRAEPFQSNDAESRNAFQRKLKAIIDQNREIGRALTYHLNEPQITDVMIQMRARPLSERKASYAANRINDQLTWYAKRAELNRKTSKGFFGALITANAVAVLCAVLRIKFAEVSFWPTDVFVAASASLLSWMQAKRFSELAGSYALAAHEIGLIRETALQDTDEGAFSVFVSDAENAFSREHTQWVARKDV